MRDENSGSFGDNVMFEDGIILPSQYFDSVGSQRLSGEQRLMLAVLVDAINVLHTWKATGRVHNVAILPKRYNGLIATKPNMLFRSTAYATL